MRSLIFALCLAGAVAACEQWPNGTDHTYHWWQCDSGNVQVFNATPFDAKGNYEYPIHLNAPLTMKLDINNPRHVYTKPNLRATIHLWNWNSCGWSGIPTFGLLNNQDACATGVQCPVKTGRQILNVVVDFTPYQTIINMLKDNSAYQLQYLLHDNQSGDNTCLTFQAWASTH